MARVLLAAMLAVVAVPVAAQTATTVPGGLELTFGFSQRLEADDNLPLAVSSPGNTVQAVTRLSFALTSETRTQKLAFTASTALRASGGSGVANGGFVVDDPRFDLSYSRNTGNAVLSFGANFRRADLQFLRPLTDFIDANGVLVLPSDLADLFGTGFRTDYGIKAALQLGVNAPFGTTVSVGVSGLAYDKVSNPALVETQRRNLSAAFRLRLNDVTDGSVTLGFDQFENLATSATTNTRSLIASLTRQLPTGSLSGTLTAQNSAVGTRLSFGVRSNMTLPTGSIGAGIGITRLAGGQPALTGNLNWVYQLPAASLSVQLNRTVAFTTANAEQLQTSLSLGYNQAINTQSAVRVNVNYALSDPAGAANNTRDTSLDASYNLAMTPDWNLSLGYNLALRNRDAVGSSHSNSVYLGIQRSFSIRP